jgi:hypothetical protein
MTGVDRMFRWWARDYPPLDGRLRAVTCLLLLALAWNGLIRGSIRAAHSCPDGLFEPAGIMQWITAAGATRDGLAATLSLLEWPLLLAWSCAALGLGGRLAPITTGVGAVFFVACSKSCAAPVNHTWDFPVLTLLALGFLCRPGRWSLDHAIATRFPGWPFAPSSGHAEDLSGYARKLVLLFLVHSLFAAGVTKMWNGGLAWMDGQSLRYYLSHSGVPRTPLGPPLLAFLQEHPKVVTGLSVGTIVLEVGSISALFLARLRWPFILSAWAFHLGIFLLMPPKYWPQMVCYLLVADWTVFTAAQRPHLMASLSGWRAPAKANSAEPLPRPGVRRAVVVSSSVICVLLAGTLCAQREWFPLSHVPMYSSYNSPERIGPFPRGLYGSMPGLRQVAHSTADNSELPHGTNNELRKRMILFGLHPDGSRESLQPGFPSDVIDERLWIPRLRNAWFDDLRDGATDHGPKPRSQKMLDALREKVLAMPAWSRFQRFELVFLGDEDGHESIVARLDRTTDDKAR